MEDNAHRYRPVLHYAPRTGFMNDPNGLVFYDGEWHLFYQYDPYEPRAGRQHWGHAVSGDLLHWQDLPIAIGETAAGQAFSGSAVFDAGNTSGLFDAGKPGLVAIYTRASPGQQRQEIAFSTDRGRSFTSHAGNPVLDRGTDSFRDPKVLWHAPSNQWVMAVAASREHLVMFYASADLKSWEEVGRFGHAGVLGINYECPDLVRLPVEGGGTKWVLFVSINPGAPQGGSTVQYFVGEFDGRHFTPDDAAARFADFGKDFYALQTFADAPGGDAVAVAWVNNWQYGEALPTGEWRGVMSLPRRLSLRRAADDWRLVQAFIPLDPARGAPVAVQTNSDANGRLAFAALPIGAAVEVRAEIEVDWDTVATLRIGNAGGETLDVGFDQALAQFFVDRGGTRGFRNRYFTDKFAAAVPYGTRAIDVHLVLDGCVLEFLGLRGEVSGTFLCFFAAPPEWLAIEAAGSVRVRSLSVTSLAA